MKSQIDFEEKCKTQMTEFTDKDQDAVFDMLIQAAVRYDRRSCGPAGLKGFEGAVMTPTVFKEQLRRTFNIKVGREPQSSLTLIGGVVPRGRHEGCLVPPCALPYG